MTMILTDREYSTCDAVKGVGAQLGNTKFAILTTLLLASVLSLMALPSIQRDSANNRIESVSVFNEQSNDGKPDPDKVLRMGTPEPPMATRSFGPAITFRSSWTTSLASGTSATNCYLHRETSDRCLEITAHAPGLH